MEDLTNNWSKEHEALLRLSVVRGVGPRIVRRLMEHFGSADAVFNATLRELGEVDMVGPQIASAIRAERDGDLIGRIKQHCREHRVRIVTMLDSEMPALLKELEDCPVVLYVKGKFEPSDAISIGIVGTRHASTYGIRATELFARGLARAGVTITSGLARGVDTVAHRSALETNGRTIAFLGSSLTDIYPSENVELAEQISKNGVLATETHPFARTRPGVFPQRNRLISGVSLGVIIVEAAERSGALITASHAGEQGRDVFAVPGSIHSRTSRGCNRLIRDGAILVQDPSDVLDHLGPLFQEAEISDERIVRHPAEMLLNEMEATVLKAIQTEPTDIDEITSRSGLNVSQVLSTISVLQMKKLIRRLSARSIQRI